MNVGWTNMTGFGPGAWNRADKPLTIPSMNHRYEQKSRRTNKYGDRDPPPPQRGITSPQVDMEHRRSEALQDSEITVNLE